MKLNINENKYNVKKKKIFTDSYQLTITPKKRTCFVCKKGFDSVGNETLSWYDDEGFYRIKYFCNKHYRLARRLLVESKRKALD
tara:strand:+ start:248 stop:499 length:252 start_codon:yes stop_codon:yes gene_type:complete